MGSPLGQDGRGLIFVSIAAYRDPQLVPTVEDCLAQARHPERLRFGICWQHAADEPLPAWFTGEQFRLIDVDHRDSEGANWARAQVMSLFQDEDWYLQLDSHHRFARDWDALLTEDFAGLPHRRAILTTYGPPYSPDDLGAAADVPMSMQFRTFTPDGLPLFVPTPVSADPGAGPRPARFASAHLLFAPASFVHDVPCDPELYFNGDEALLAVRAYTHGYDLYEPSRTIVWHHYERSAPKHWDDHDGAGATAWHARDAGSRAKMRRILGGASVGSLGLGSARSLADYEAYAGIDFRHGRVQDHTLHNLVPPNPPAAPDWALTMSHHVVTVPLVAPDLASDGLGSIDGWYVAVQDTEGRDLHRCQVPAASTAVAHEVTVEFYSQASPHTWTATPHHPDSGWLPSSSGVVDEHRSVRLDARRPRRTPGVRWQPAGDRLVATLPATADRAALARELNTSGALLVEMADGAHSIREIAAFLRASHGLAEDPLPEVHEFYESASSAGLVTMGSRDG